MCILPSSNDGDEKKDPTHSPSLWLGGELREGLFISQPTWP